MAMVQLLHLINFCFVAFQNCLISSSSILIGSLNCVPSKPPESRSINISTRERVDTDPRHSIGD